MNTTCWWQVKWNVQRTTIKSADKKIDAICGASFCGNYMVFALICKGPKML